MAGAAPQRAYDGYNRGIHNVQVIPHPADKSAEARFVKEESMEAKVYDRAMKGEAVNDAFYAQTEQEVANDAFYAQQVAVKWAREALETRAKGKALLARRAVGRSTLIISIVIAAYAYVIQFVFACISLIGFGLYGAVSYLEDETFFGKLVSTFFSFKDVLPAQELGLAFWGLTTVLCSVVFVAYFLWFHFIGRDPFDTPISSIITIVCLSLSLVPVLQIFPWLLIWVVYLSVTEITRIARSMVGRK